MSGVATTRGPHALGDRSHAVVREVPPTLDLARELVLEVEASLREGGHRFLHTIRETIELYGSAGHATMATELCRMNRFGGDIGNVRRAQIGRRRRPGWRTRADGTSCRSSCAAPGSARGDGVTLVSGCNGGGDDSSSPTTTTAGSNNSSNDNSSNSTTKTSTTSSSSSSSASIESLQTRLDTLGSTRDRWTASSGPTRSAPSGTSRPRRGSPSTASSVKSPRRSSRPPPCRARRTATASRRRRSRRPRRSPPRDRRARSTRSRRACRRPSCPASRSCSPARSTAPGSSW